MLIPWKTFPSLYCFFRRKVYSFKRMFVFYFTANFVVDKLDKIATLILALEARVTQGFRLAIALRKIVKKALFSLVLQ
jgi:hypothetical protein